MLNMLKLVGIMALAGLAYGASFIAGVELAGRGINKLDDLAERRRLAAETKNTQRVRAA